MFILLAGVTVWLQRSGRLENQEPTPTARPRLFLFQEDAIQSVRLESAAGQSIALEKDTAGDFKLKDPGELMIGDPAKINSAISTLATLQGLNTLENDLPLDSIGLLPADYNVTIVTQDGQETRLSIGAKTQTGSGYYVQTQDGSLSVVSSFNVEAVLALLTDPSVLVTPIPEVTITPVEGTPPAGDPVTPTAVP